MKRQKPSTDAKNLATIRAKTTADVRNTSWSPGRKEGTKKMTKKQIRDGLKAKDKFYDTFMKDSDKSKGVYLTFECRKVEVDGTVSYSEYHSSAKLTHPIVRAFVRFSTSRTNEKIEYEFRKPGGKIDYRPLVAFLKFCKERKFAHTPDSNQLVTLLRFVAEIDDYMNPNIENMSGTLVRMTAEMTKSCFTFAEFNPLSPIDIPLAKTSARFIYNTHLTNDITLPRDDHMMMGFEKRPHT